jgi:tetratricopeptide (TPR) repeat protein
LKRGLEESSQIERFRATDSPIDPPGRVIILTSLSRALALAGDPESARRAVEQAARLLDEHPVADERLLMSYLAFLAQAQAKIGDEGAARKNLARLRDLAAQGEQPTRLSGLMLLIQSKARMGDFDGAFGLALAPPSEFGGFWDEQIRAGDTQTLSTLAQSIDKEHGEDARKAVERLLRVPVMTTRPGVFIESRGRNALLATSAQTQLRLDDIEGAVTTIDHMDDDGMKADALVTVAEAEIEAGQIEPARATLREALGRARRGTPERYLSSVLAKIARMQARAGDAQGAMETLQQSKENGTIVELNTQVEAARALKKAGDTDGARNLLDRARKLAEQDKGNSLDAVRQAMLGNFEAALRLAEGIQDERQRQQAIGAVATYQVDAGDTAGALAWIARRPPSEQSALLGAAVRGLARRADLPATLRRSN